MARKMTKVALSLGVTPAGLRVLARQAAGRTAWPGNAGQKLIAQGYLDGFGDINDAGRALVERARQLRW